MRNVLQVVKETIKQMENLFLVLDIQLKIYLTKRICSFYLLCIKSSWLHFICFFIRNQDFDSAQPIEKEFDFRPAVGAAISSIGCALLSKPDIKSFESDQQRQLELT